MWLGSGLDIFEHMRNALLEERDKMVGEYKATGSDKERKIPAANLSDWSGAFSKFQKTAGLPFLNSAELNIISFEESQRHNSYQRHKRQDGKIPVSVLERRRPLVLGGNLKISVRLPGRPFVVSAAADLRWNGLLNTATPTFVLMNEGHVWCDPETQTRRKPVGRPWVCGFFLLR